MDRGREGRARARARPSDVRGTALVFHDTGMPGENDRIEQIFFFDERERRVRLVDLDRRSVAVETARLRAVLRSLEPQLLGPRCVRLEGGPCLGPASLVRFERAEIVDGVG